MNTDKLHYATHQIMLDIDSLIYCLYKVSLKYQLNDFTELKINLKTVRHVNATKSYLHFDRFTGEAILCSNFFCFLLFLDVLFLA